jgi:hypothetical protein
MEVRMEEYIFLQFLFLPQRQSENCTLYLGVVRGAGDRAEAQARQML